MTNFVYWQRYADLVSLIGVQCRTGAAFDDSTKVAYVDRLVDVEFGAAKYAAWLKDHGGYDGAILRDPNAGYTIGEAKLGQIIKIKPVMSLDLKVVMVNQALGEQTGRTVYTLDVEYQGVITTVGSGVPHDPRDHNGFDGIAEIECMGLTEDGKLREPRFRGIRYDKLKAD